MALGTILLLRHSYRQYLLQTHKPDIRFLGAVVPTNRCYVHDSPLGYRLYCRYRVFISKQINHVAEVASAKLGFLRRRFRLSSAAYRQPIYT